MAECPWPDCKAPTHRGVTVSPVDGEFWHIDCMQAASAEALASRAEPDEVTPLFDQMFDDLTTLATRASRVPAADAVAKLVEAGGRLIHELDKRAGKVRFPADMLDAARDINNALAALQSAPERVCGTCRYTSKVEPEAFVACGNRDGFYGMGVSMDDPLDGCNRWKQADEGEGES